MWLMVESNHRLCYQGSAPLADALPVELISRKNPHSRNHAGKYFNRCQFQYLNNTFQHFLLATWATF